MPIVDLHGRPAAAVDALLSLWCVYKTECPTSAVAWPCWKTLSGLLPVVAVAQNTADEVHDFVGTPPPSLALTLDPEPYAASSRLRVLYTPTVFLVENGVVSKVIEAWQRDAYQEMVDDLAARRGVPSPSLDGYPEFQYG
ncbi:MAG TPA: hypothetical protein VGO93_11095 [Candidatus Xenobia bacterium]